MSNMDTTLVVCTCNLLHNHGWKVANMASKKLVHEKQSNKMAGKICQAIYRNDVICFGYKFYF